MVRSPFPLVLATRNPGKAREFGRLLGPAFAVEPLPPEVPLPEETGGSFYENAALKAEAVFRALWERTMVLADDSGLEVDGLDGRPGVQSARYAGEGATDQDNIDRLLKEMEGEVDRKARFVCALAMFVPLAEDEGCRFFATEGVLEGEILEAPRGSGGFGYDPVFRPLGWTVTLAEGTAEEKDAVSHRGAAAAELLELLQREGMIDDG